MKADRVSQSMLRDLKPKGVLQCELPTAKACYSARTQCSHVKNKTGYELTCHINFAENTVTIIRLK